MAVKKSAFFVVAEKSIITAGEDENVSTAEEHIELRTALR